MPATSKRAISKAYNDALQAAVRKNKDFLRKIRDIDTGKIKPPAAYTTQKQIDAWRRGYIKRAEKQMHVVESMAAEMQQAGIAARKGIQTSMISVYGKTRKSVWQQLEKALPADLPQLSKQKIGVLLYGRGNTSAFAKIAFNRLESDAAIRRRLRRQFAQSIQRGESQEQLLARIRKVTGRERGDAMRILRTESTHIESLARQQTAMDYWHATGVKPQKRWVCTFHNSRDSHIAMNGQTVDIDEDFILPSGQKISYPGDSKAGPAEVCNCQCYMEIV